MWVCQTVVRIVVVANIALLPFTRQSRNHRLVSETTRSLNDDGAYHALEHSKTRHEFLRHGNHATDIPSKAWGAHGLLKRRSYTRRVFLDTWEILTNCNERKERYMHAMTFAFSMELTVHFCIAIATQHGISARCHFQSSCSHPQKLLPLLYITTHPIPYIALSTSLLT